jgi:hypothetical protein
MKHIRRHLISLVGLLGASQLLLNVLAAQEESSAFTQLDHATLEHFETYCFNCHGAEVKKGNLDLTQLLFQEDKDLTLVFENLITSRMPPAKKEQPDPEERQAMLEWLANRQPEHPPATYRRINRHEFVQSANDLLGVHLDLTGSISEDRGTYDFDTDRRVQVTREMLNSYFNALDEMLEFALPAEGFVPEQTWITNQIKDSHETYKIYTRPYLEGLLFSWTRSNNGNNYSFFYDTFDPPVKGWYELSFDAMKLGDFPEDVSLMVFAGKYFHADDRPQPQRLLDVISLGNKTLQTHTIQGFLHPGENVSVHCYSRHNFRQRDGDTGAYIKQLKVRGPIYDSWPPSSYQNIFAGTPLSAPPRQGPLTSISVKSTCEDHLRKALRRFAEQAFSSELTDAELEPYENLAINILREQGDFVAATRVGLKAILSSHRFLMVPGEHANSSFADAAFLSRALWLSVPDQELMDLAKVNQLKGQTLEAQIERMLSDKKTERMIHSFCNQWLNLRKFEKITPSLKLYPLYDDLLNRFLPMETEAYLNHLIQENLPVSLLIDSDFSFLNQRLAQHYGIDGVFGQQLRKVSFDSKTPRGGLMTMGSILKVTSDGFDTSPILRGAWISKNIAGNTLSPPPESVKAIEPEHGEAATSLREQIELHKNSPSCYACHKSIDPYGFAFESFDATGQWRSRYKVKLPHAGTFQYRLEGYFRLGAEVDASGEIDRRSFGDVFGLKQILLSDHKKIAYNFVRKFFEYANGYKPSLRQRLDLVALIRNEPNECRMRDLMIQTLIYSLKEEKQ